MNESWRNISMNESTTPATTTTLPLPTATINPTDLLAGCALAIGGNLLISISLNVQKFSHMKNAAAETEEQKHYTRNPLWWIGMILMGFGEVGNFAAYGFAPASLVAPLGTTTVIANMFLAVLFLKERLRPEDLFGCALAIVGAFLIVNFSSKKEQVLNGNELALLLIQPAFLVYVSIEVVMLIVLFILKYKFDKDNVLVLLLITALLASFTVIGAKAVSSMLQLTIAGNMQLDKPIFYVMLVVMAVTIVGQIKFLNLAMKAYDSTVVVPTNFVFFTISAIVAGIIYYRELWGLGALDIFMFLFGCLMSFVGVFFITAGRKSADSSQEELEERRISMMPTWLISKVHKSEVQPRHDATSVGVSDTRPILSDQYPPSEDSSSSYNSPDLSGIHKSPEHNINNSYGATNEKTP